MARTRSLLAALVLGGALCAAPAFQGAPEERAFLALLDKEHRPLEAREAARAYLKTHPGSFLAEEACGIVYLFTDGDLPKALYHLGRARSLMEAFSRGDWGPGSPAGNYAATLHLLSTTQFRMERYGEALATLATLEATFSTRYPELFAWPLMKLGRTQEARSRIEEAIRSGKADAAADALNTLAALEAEADRPEEAFATEQRLLDLDRPKGKDADCTFLRNAAEGAQRLGRFERAERLLLEASDHFKPSSVSNPWGDLAGLYLWEGRHAEAVDAVKRMQEWAFRSRPLAAETHWNERQMLTGGLLLLCGCTDEALVLARRVAERPDRHATGSARQGQLEAGTQLFRYQTLLDALARDGE